MQSGAFLPQHSVYRLKASAMYADISCDHKRICIRIYVKLFDKLLHRFGNVPFVHRTDKSDHIGFCGKTARNVFLYRNNNSTADTRGYDPCGSQTVSRAAETVYYIFHISTFLQQSKVVDIDLIVRFDVLLCLL